MSGNTIRANIEETKMTNHSKRNLMTIGVIVVSTVAISAIMNSLSSANTNSVALNLEDATLSNSKCLKTSSGNSYVQFGSACAPGSDSPGPAPTPGAAANVEMITTARATAQERTGRRVLNSGHGNYGEQSYKLNAGNPYRYTPSADLNIDDYVVDTGDRYANYAQRSNGGVFHVTCQFSHFAYDDPIVFPDQPGVSHLHMFFGNTHSNAYSTPDSILNEGGSTCSRGELNRTSYWVPAFIDTGRNNNLVIPDEFMVYYESFDGEQAKVQDFPDGLRMVTGDALAKSVQPNVGNFGSPLVRWKCGWYDNAFTSTSSGRRGEYQKTPPYCSAGSYSHVEFQIKWPYCWDGKNLDVADHKSHVVFPATGNNHLRSDTCPSSHPNVLPRITYRLHFKTNQISSSQNLLLSSDVQKQSRQNSPFGVSGHGDWFGGWNRSVLKILMDNCVRHRGESCDPEHLGDPAGRQFSKTFTGGRTINADLMVDYCPKRTSPATNVYDLAYCTAD